MEDKNEKIIKFSGDNIKKIVAESVKKILYESQNYIDNFDLAASMLDTHTPDDFHFVQITKRFKDNPNDDKNVGNYHNHSWFLNGYRVHSKEELMRLKPEIIDKCEKNNARAYMTINSRSEKETDNYIKVYKAKFPASDARNIHANDIIPGQAKDGPSWQGMRKRIVVDVDVPKTGTTQDGSNLWNDVRSMIKMTGIVPLGEYETSSGGLHIILPDKEDKRFLYLKKLFQKYDNWKNRGRLSTVHPNVDGKIILYSNVKTKGY